MLTCRKDVAKVNERIKTEKTDYLCRALAELKTPEEAEALLEDLCTIAELQEMSNRLVAARMLDAGKTYLEICAATGLSTATVTRVNRARKYGSGGYELILGRLKESGE